jgi:acetyl esterase/lipase
MLKVIFAIILFLLSLLTVFRAPTNMLWYVSILVTEFSWLFVLAALLLLISAFRKSKFRNVLQLISLAALVLFTVPIFSAYTMSSKVTKTFSGSNSSEAPFSIGKLITGINKKQVRYNIYKYDTANSLTLDFYPSATTGKKPCIVVVHGGSWAGGDSRQLPELNSELAKAGYNVASLDYRLAPAAKFPAPIEDIKTALAYLKAHATGLAIDTNRFVLLGRSAGGQIVLTAAYTLRDPAIKGIVSFYGPTDMIWGYANPTNPLVLNSRKVMEDYLGGTYDQVPKQYEKSSATEIVQANAPPTLQIYGENDPLVSHLHGHRLSKKLDSLGNKHYDLYLPWATHGFDWTLNGPGGQLSTWSVMQFLKQVF